MESHNGYNEQLDCVAVRHAFSIGTLYRQQSYDLIPHDNNRKRITKRIVLNTTTNVTEEKKNLSNCVLKAADTSSKRITERNVQQTLPPSSDTAHYNNFNQNLTDKSLIEHLEAISDEHSVDTVIHLNSSLASVDDCRERKRYARDSLGGNNDKLNDFHSHSLNNKQNDFSKLSNSDLHGTLIDSNKDLPVRKDWKKYNKYSCPTSLHHQSSVTTHQLRYSNDQEDKTNSIQDKLPLTADNKSNSAQFVFSRSISQQSATLSDNRPKLFAAYSLSTRIAAESFREKRFPHLFTNTVDECSEATASIPDLSNGQPLNTIVENVKECISSSHYSSKQSSINEWSIPEISYNDNLTTQYHILQNSDSDDNLLCPSIHPNHLKSSNISYGSLEKDRTNVINQSQTHNNLFQVPNKYKYKDLPEKKSESCDNHNPTNSVTSIPNNKNQHLEISNRYIDIFIENASDRNSESFSTSDSTTRENERLFPSCSINRLYVPKQDRKVNEFSSLKKRASSLSALPLVTHTFNNKPIVTKEENNHPERILTNHQNHCLYHSNQSFSADNRNRRLIPSNNYYPKKKRIEDTLDLWLNNHKRTTTNINGSDRCNHRQGGRAQLLANDPSVDPLDQKVVARDKHKTKLSSLNILTIGTNYSKTSRLLTNLNSRTNNISSTLSSALKNFNSSYINQNDNRHNRKPIINNAFSEYKKRPDSKRIRKVTDRINNWKTSPYLPSNFKILKPQLKQRQRIDSVKNNKSFPNKEPSLTERTSLIQSTVNYKHPKFTSKNTQDSNNTNASLTNYQSIANASAVVISNPYSLDPQYKIASNTSSQNATQSESPCDKNLKLAPNIILQPQKSAPVNQSSFQFTTIPKHLSAYWDRQQSTSFVKAKSNNIITPRLRNPYIIQHKSLRSIRSNSNTRSKKYQNKARFSASSTLRTVHQTLSSIHSSFSKIDFNMGHYKLGLRKHLFEKRRLVADWSLFTALLGIVIMVLETEFIINSVYLSNSIKSVVMKSMISVSTLILLCLISFYHFIDFQLYMLDNGVDDWRIAINFHALLAITIELIICAVHPLPAISDIYFQQQQHNFLSNSLNTTQASTTQINTTTSTVESALMNDDFKRGRSSALTKLMQVSHIYHGMKSNVSKHLKRQRQSSYDIPLQKNYVNDPHVYRRQKRETNDEHLTGGKPAKCYDDLVSVSIDVALSVPMWARLYLVGRVLLLHSRLYTDTASRSIGALNRVNIDTRFVLKTLTTLRPATVLMVYIISYVSIASWTLRACESNDSNILTFPSAVWLVAITFLAIGYGDVVPKTIIGRIVCVMSGLMGAFCTALVVAVLARKLELSRAEKHVHNFMMDTALNKQLKNTAANILRETWLIYKYTHLVKKISKARVRLHQRKFLRAIHRFRRVKLDQRKLTENANSLTDMAKVQNNIYETVSNFSEFNAAINQRMGELENNVKMIQKQFTIIPNEIAQVVSKKNKELLLKLCEMPTPYGSRNDIHQIANNTSRNNIDCFHTNQCSINSNNSSRQLRSRNVGTRENSTRRTSNDSNPNCCSSSIPKLPTRYEAKTLLPDFCADIQHAVPRQDQKSLRKAHTFRFASIEDKDSVKCSGRKSEVIPPISQSVKQENILLNKLDLMKKMNVTQNSNTKLSNDAVRITTASTTSTNTNLVFQSKMYDNLYNNFNENNKQN
ncbi:hypothetical protein SNEBB_010692 [Seison nebaliae]|nr:hypothetical protein SNEBB_010692 [Seison nebaliae]